MHICLITPSFPPMVDGGVAIATGRLVERFLALGHQVSVLTATPTGVSSHFPAWHPEATPGLTLSYGIVEDPLQDPLAVEALWRWAQARHQQLAFDVILAYFIYPGGYLGTLLGARLQVPVVCSCRGNDVSKAMFIDPQTIAAVLQRSTGLIFVSASLRRMAETLAPCGAKSTVVANAVDTALFVPARRTIPSPTLPVVLGSSGVWRWKKGLDLLLPLIQHLCARPRVQILLAGYGLDEEVTQQITSFLTRHQLQSRVDLTGAIPHPRMVEALQRMHLYVTTSYQEGMPNGVLEAMACALPVVATDADAIPDLVEDGVTGYICRMGDLETLLARCHTLIAQPALRQRMGEAGRHRVQQRFAPAHEAAAVEAVLRQACSSYTAFQTPGYQQM